MDKEHFIKMAEQTTKEEFSRGWVYLGQRPINWGLYKFKGLVRPNRSYQKDLPELFVGSIMYGDGELAEYYMHVSKWASYIQSPLPAKLKIWEKEENIAQFQKEIAELKEQEKKNELDAYIKIFSINLPNAVEGEGDSDNYHFVKWEIRDNPKGGQLAVPILI